jgi:predicted nicotinamide N-methyase
MTVPEALLDSRLRRFRLRRHRLHCAGGLLSVVAPARADDLLEGGAAVDCLRRQQMPYWAEVWPASVAIARLLMRGPDLSGMSAMDLGCGIGIAGLAAATRSASVHFVDVDPDALAFAAFNSRNTDSSGLRRTSHQQLDWFSETADGRFDLILMSDVAYEERNFEPLRRHLRRCLAPAGHALVGDPYRAATGAFVDSLPPEFTTQTVGTDTHFDGVRTPIRLTTVRRALLPTAGEGPTP